MRCRIGLSTTSIRWRSAVFPLLCLLAVILSGFLPTRSALADDVSGEQAVQQFTDVDSLVDEVTPGAVMTHDKGNALWKTSQVEDYKVTLLNDSQQVPWTPPDPGYWSHGFGVVGKDADHLPEYEAIFYNALTWVDPTTGEAQDMDFKIHYQALGSTNDGNTPQVQQRLVNAFYTTGISHSRVTYQIFPHDEDTPLNPGKFVYWCRSLNPNESVTFDARENQGVHLDHVYVTDKGLFDESFVANARPLPEHLGEASVRADVTDDGQVITFTGTPSLTCSLGSELDVSDEGEAFHGSCTHAFVESQTPGETHRALSFHERTIPYSEYIEYRAVTFDLSLDSQADAGVTLDYHTPGDFYWEMQFNGILTTRQNPVKAVVGSDETQPGGTVRFTVTQSLDDIPAGLLDTMVFEDELPDGLTPVDATMTIDGGSLPEGAGKPTISGQKVTYSFPKDVLDGLTYGKTGSRCVLTIDAKVSDTAKEGDTFANSAVVTLNNDVGTSKEVVVRIPVSQKPEIDVKPNQGIMVLDKSVSTPDGSRDVTVDDPVRYDIFIENDTDHSVENIVVEDSLPSGLVLSKAPWLADEAYKEVASSDCEYWLGSRRPDGSIVQTYDGYDGSRASGSGSPTQGSHVWDGSVVASITRMEPGQKLHLIIDAAIALNGSGSIENVATLSAKGFTTQISSVSVQVHPKDGGDDPGGSGGSGSDGQDKDDPGGSNPSGTSPGDTNPNTPGGDQPSDPSGGGTGDGDVSDDKDPNAPDGEDPGGDGPNDPSDADGPNPGDPDNSGGNTGGDGDTGGDDDSSGTGGGSDPGNGTGGSSDSGGGNTGGGSTGPYSGTGTGTTTPSSGYSGTDSAMTMASTTGQEGTSAKAKRLLPQTDVPPVIGIATTGGIGMTMALAAHTIWNSRNRRR